MGGMEAYFAEEMAKFDKELWGEYFAPPTQETIIECSERIRVLSSKDSSEPGPYKAKRTPYVIEPTNCLNPGSETKEVVLKWGAQTAKTSMLLNWTAFIIENNPSPMMIVQPTIDMAKRFSRQRLQSMINDSPYLTKRVQQQRSRDDANTIMLKEFNGGYLVLAGANSAAGLRSAPICYLCLDEIDAYPTDVEGEGDPVGLAMMRQTTFPQSKTIITSTPTIKGFSKIDDRFAMSDQCFYYVPCPHCGEKQILEMDDEKKHGLKWLIDDSGMPVAETVLYTCKHCGGIFDESHKTSMLEKGVWVPHAPQNGTKTRGFQLSGLYSPLGWLSWFEIAAEYCKARQAETMGDTSLMRVFVNTRIGDTYEDKGDKANASELHERAGNWPLKVVLTNHYVITFGVDVQPDRLHLVAYAWGRGMRRQVLDRRIFYGDPSKPESDESSPWRALTEWYLTPIYNEKGKRISILAGMIDSGGANTQSVYLYARAHQHQHIYACKGQSQKNKPIIGKPSEPEVLWNGKKVKCGLKLWPIGTDTAKSEIYGRLRVRQEGDGFINVTKQIDPDFFKQITSEMLVTKLKNGRPTQEWVLPHGKRNEDLDCSVYALAAAYYAGIDRYKEGDWLVLFNKIDVGIEENIQKPALKTKEQKNKPIARMFQS